GIRDRNVTGVQTCALPISSGTAPWACSRRLPDGAGPLVERWRLEHAHGAVPEDGLGLQDPGAEVEAGGSIDVEDGVVAGDAIARHLLAFGGARETGRHDCAAGQDQLGPRLGEE